MFISQIQESIIKQILQKIKNTKPQHLGQLQAVANAGAALDEYNKHGDKRKGGIKGFFSDLFSDKNSSKHHMGPQPSGAGKGDGVGGKKHEGVPLMA